MNEKLLFEKAECAGFEACELYYTSHTEATVGVCEGEVDNHVINSSQSVCFRGLLNGKMGYAYTQKVDDDSINLLIETAKECADLVENEDKEFIHDGSGEYTVVEHYDEAIPAVTTHDHVNQVITLENSVKQLAPELEKVAKTQISLYTTQSRITNSYGLDLSNQGTQVTAYTVPVAKDGEGVVNHYEVFHASQLSDFDLNQFVESAIRKTVRQVGAASIPSGKYPTIFENNVMATLLSTMQPSFFADVMQNGKSLLKGKVGEKIAADCVSIIDDPHMEGALGSCGFDDEGIPTYKKTVVEKGVFSGFLHNLKTAYKEGVQTTGNASKGSISSPVRVASSNLYIEPSETTLEALLQQAQNGIYITNLDGVHAGANAITGDFSLAARGLLIENGQLTKAVKQITIAGNFFELLKEITTVGNDFKMNGSVGSPSVLVKEVSVAGK